MPTFRRPHSRFWVYLSVVVAAVVVATVLLAYLFSATPLGRDTVDGGVARISEGRDAFGPWFQPPVRNYSGTDGGFPITLAAGSTFQVALPLTNTGQASHTVEDATVAAPFSLAGTNVPLPVTIPSGQDATLLLTLKAPTSAGTYSFTVTVLTA